MELRQKISLMQNPNKWSLRPFLPLRRFKENRQELGFLYVLPTPREGGKGRLYPDVFLGSIYHPDKEMTVRSHEEVMALNRRSYHSFSSLLFDGWEVIADG